MQTVKLIWNALISFQKQPLLITHSNKMTYSSTHYKGSNTLQSCNNRPNYFIELLNTPNETLPVVLPLVQFIHPPYLRPQRPLHPSGGPRPPHPFHYRPRSEVGSNSTKEVLEMVIQSMHPSLHSTQALHSAFFQTIKMMECINPLIRRYNVIQSQQLSHTCPRFSAGGLRLLTLAMSSYPTLTLSKRNKLTLLYQPTLLNQTKRT